jgi:hypothetical protein
MVQTACCKSIAFLFVSLNEIAAAGLNRRSCGVCWLIGQHGVLPLAEVPAAVFDIAHVPVLAAASTHLGLRHLPRRWEENFTN